MEHLGKINSKTASGSVNIDVRVFKECANELTPIITGIFNTDLATNIIPDEWKVAHNTPIYKGKGNKECLDNYRPISILSPISRVFKGILGFKMRLYFENNYLLHPGQNGFREGGSCHLELDIFANYAKWKLDMKNNVIAILRRYDSVFSGYKPTKNCIRSRRGPRPHR